MKISKEIKAGIIALFAIASFILIFQYMKGKSIFTTDNVFYAKYDNVEGLGPSSKVSINGLKVGQVDKIIPVTSKDGKIYFLVRLIVDNDFSFSKKSTVEIFEPGLMSGKEMKINLDYTGPKAVDGDTLQGAFKLSMLNSLSSQVGPVKDQISEVLKRVDSLANSANKVLDERNRQEIRALLANLNTTVAGFENASKSANSLLANNDPRLQKILDNANVAVVSANTAVGKYGKLAESIDAQKLNTTIASLDATVNKLNGVISGIDRGEGSLGKLAKDEQLYNNLEQATKNLNDLVLDLKTNPKRYINFSVFGKNNKD